MGTFLLVPHSLWNSLLWEEELAPCLPGCQGRLKTFAFVLFLLALLLSQHLSLAVGQIVFLLLLLLLQFLFNDFLP